MDNTIICPKTIEPIYKPTSLTYSRRVKHTLQKQSVGKKCVFLDIDGVLNNMTTSELCCGFIGIDDGNLLTFSRLIKETDAMILLTSTWREFWEKDDKDKQDEMANYLDMKLAKYNIKIYDKTCDNYENRGYGILKSIEKYNIKRYVVLDDIFFSDYTKPEIYKHFVQTDEIVGLTEKDVDEAIQILNGHLKITS